MAILANTQWEIFARKLVEIELACVDENMTARRGELRHKAYGEAGYSGNADNARRLANKRTVKARVAELFKEALEYRDVDVVKVVNRIDRVGRANVQDLYDENGQIRPLHALPRDVAQTIESIEYEPGELDKAGKPLPARLAKVKLRDANQANFTLLKHLGGLPEPPPPANYNLLSVLSIDDQRIIIRALQGSVAAGPGNPEQPAEAIANGTGGDAGAAGKEFSPA